MQTMHFNQSDHAFQSVIGSMSSAAAKRAGIFDRK
jgi:hypothetical protein